MSKRKTNNTGFWLKMTDGAWIRVNGDPNNNELAKAVVLRYEAKKDKAAADSAGARESEQ